MGGKMPPEWWREYRRRRAEHLREYNRQRRQQPKVKAQRKACEAKRRRKQCCMDDGPLPVLMPEFQHGAHYSFWEDELRLDLAQEVQLAILEGRCPEDAVKAYRAREYAWRRVTGPLVNEEHLEGSGGESSLAW